jgi:outer membrane lipoprotein-sorting protein
VRSSNASAERQRRTRALGGSSFGDAYLSGAFFGGAALAACALALTLAVTGPTGHAQDDGRGHGEAALDALLARFAAVPGMRCRFREEKRIALLSAPVVSEGTLDYAAPGWLARRVTRPAPQLVLIGDGQLRMRDASGHVETLDLAAQPVVRSFVDTFSLLFSGSRAALERTYRVQYAPDAGGTGWTLTLTPKVAPLDRFLAEIRVEGEATTLRRMVMREVSSDVTTTTFEDVDVAHRFSDAERARVFSLR